MYETDFQITGREPLMWLNSAAHLRRSAELLQPAIDDAVAAFQSGEDRDEIFIAYPCLMLRGMALENVYKGILVAREPSAVKPDRLDLSGWTGGEHPHDLLHLATLARLELAEDERDFLLRAGEAVHWHGRYPIPKKSVQLEKKGLLRGGHGSRRSFSTSDPAIFRQLYDAGEVVLKAEARTAEGRRRKSEWDSLHDSDSAVP